MKETFTIERIYPYSFERSLDKLRDH
ncbi:hypothetical protein RRG08_003185 [Elysia crispata]|uniref:Uncharacterized protein n=1 Tax=Elysia crispata TaxID=231223 RepID=A0AAE1B8G0_9GAST|nr:hypothetical protein RRG08_003185 [Elysia crispata]